MTLSNLKGLTLQSGVFVSLLKFECLKCANCCRELITPLPIGTGQIHQGLCLFEEETSLFSSEKVMPLGGYGVDPYNRRFKVVSFQFIENKCPHLKGRSCSIYDKRPLSCQSYPVSPNPRGFDTKSFWIDPECSWAKKYMPEGNPKKVRLGEERFALSEILSRRMLMREAYRGLLWLFDLKKMEWILFSQI